MGILAKCMTQHMSAAMRDIELFSKHNL